MAEIFRTGEENTAARCDPSCEDFDATGAEKIAKPAKVKILMIINSLQSFELGPLRPGRRRAKLTVFTPRRFTFLARTQNPGAPTIPFKQDRL
jgi:hypothetical protein